MTPTRQRRAVGGLGTPTALSMRQLAGARRAGLRDRRYAQQVAVPPARSRDGARTWLRLLSSYFTNNPTDEDALPEADAGPSPRPGARILGGPS